MLSQETMDDKTKILLNNFYKTRRSLFWTAPDGPGIYYGAYSYQNLSKTLEKKDSISQDSVHTNAVHRLLNCSTRTVLYNLMFMSDAWLLKMMDCVLNFIHIDRQTPQEGFHNLVSIYNCIWLLFNKGGKKTNNDTQKKLNSDRIATYMEVEMLCPCVPTNNVKGFQNLDYTLVLNEALTNVQLP